MASMMNLPTPWGPAQHVKDYGQGILEVETAGHGGIYVPNELLHLIPAKERRFAAAWSHGWGENWFEEDCAAISPMYHFGLRPERMEDVKKWYNNQKWGE